tara:strand:- start:653 stop:832 length:180 start_codon:yes stop_codon:yes gene_type:complete
MYAVTLDFAGYSRGYEVRMVEANSPEEARENWYEGEVVENETIRDDLDREVTEVIEVDE